MCESAYRSIQNWSSVLHLQNMLEWIMWDACQVKQSQECSFKLMLLWRMLCLGSTYLTLCQGMFFLTFTMLPWYGRNNFLMLLIFRNMVTSSDLSSCAMQLVNGVEFWCIQRGATWSATCQHNILWHAVSCFSSSLQVNYNAFTET